MSGGLAMHGQLARRVTAGLLAALAALAAGLGSGNAEAASAAATAAGRPEPQRELAVCADPANLPYSNDRGEGFENRIARLLADDLHARLRYAWNLQRRGFLRRTLDAGRCDVVIGAPVGLRGLLLTRPYYASSYVFVTARERGLALAGFDDPALRELRIGLQAVGAEGGNTPPAMALARRGLVQHITGYPMWAGENEVDPQGRIVDAVASGEIDVAIVWGPFAGWFARRHGDRLALAPVPADPLDPGQRASFDMALGVRRGDTALLAELQAALDRHRPEIDALLRDYGIPLLAANDTEGK
ncbi:quinoprotein dehydrogenase-associated putative ABC transporter substrate-binding protein [Derxia lacustris]|uniref:quinoprotein dehydrogenase-associated putative ABC transporter substrate-binding protein n=1 Tax=Derxia lacustris TaxID=764842 RepID=UPI001F287C6B|nr:quinoprotein dehydrogenase-associated putative ABC transporter substrate-binding protein [Derxia lacustris]